MEALFNSLLISLGLIAVIAVLFLVRTTSGRTSYEWKTVRLAVLKRDNYTCQKCGKVGGYFEVHHIKSWSKYPALRFTMSNLQTLCSNCHQQTDSYKYWKSKNN
jgi:5-methylcytosine-specific restriction endonuclease McrA